MLNNAAQRIVMRPPRPLIRMNAMQATGVPLGHKPMSEAAAEESMMELVGHLANGNQPVNLDPQTAEILAKVLGKHGRHK